MCAITDFILVLLVAYVLFLSRIECKVADRSNEAVDSKCDVTEDEVPTGLGGKSFRLQRSVVDYDTSYPSQEKCQKKTNKLVVIHSKIPFIYKMIFDDI